MSRSTGRRTELSPSAPRWLFGLVSYYGPPDGVDGRRIVKYRLDQADVDCKRRMALAAFVSQNAPSLVATRSYPDRLALWQGGPATANAVRFRRILSALCLVAGRFLSTRLVEARAHGAAWHNRPGRHGDRLVGRVVAATRQRRRVQIAAMIKRTLAKVSNAANRLAPAGKRLLPKSVQRFILLHVLDVNREYNSFDDLPSRHFLEHDVLPWLQDQASASIVRRKPHRILITTRNCFERNPDRFVTIDFQPQRQGLGRTQAYRSLPSRTSELHEARCSFDCVILNGVFGFGVDEIKEMRATVEAVHAIMRPRRTSRPGLEYDRHAAPDAPPGAGAILFGERRVTVGPAKALRIRDTHLQLLHAPTRP